MIQYRSHPKDKTNRKLIIKSRRSARANMTIREWIREREIRGITMFSLETLKKAFPSFSQQAMSNALSRLKKANVIYSPYSSFYIALPPQYVLRGTVPPYYFMDALMREQKREYYFGLLSAAALWGAGHQRSQMDYVVTTPPRLSRSETSKRRIRWVYKDAIPTLHLREKNGEAGTVKYSDAELTAIDLVQYEHLVGGLSVAATVLAELLEVTDFRKAAGGLFTSCPSASVQRLGYIVERVLGDSWHGKVIFSEWRKLHASCHYVPLSPRAVAEGTRDERWRIIVNTEVEADET